MVSSFLIVNLRPRSTSALHDNLMAHPIFPSLGMGMGRGRGTNLSRNCVFERIKSLRCYELTRGSVISCFHRFHHQGWAARQIACELQTWLKFIQVPKNWIFGFSLPFFFTIDFKICLYVKRFDTSHCSRDIFWLCIANSPKLWENNLIAENVNEVHWHILFSQSIEELTRCSQNMPCEQCEVSKRLLYRKRKTKNSVSLELE